MTVPIECESSSDAMQLSIGAPAIVRPVMQDALVVSRPSFGLPMFAAVLFVPSMITCPGPPTTVCGWSLPGSATL